MVNHLYVVVYLDKPIFIHKTLISFHMQAVEGMVVHDQHCEFFSKSPIHTIVAEIEMLNSLFVDSQLYRFYKAKRILFSE